MAENIRIEKITDMVHKGMVVADIGTDHAFLPILLVRNGISEKVYACDIARGPLQAADQNIRRAGYQDQITTILTDGLKDVPEDVSCVVIAGMGKTTAVGILERAMERLPVFQQIIVEVNRDTIAMRRWISDHGFTIADEMHVEDRGHDYVTIDFNTAPHEPYTLQEVVLGPVLMKQKSPAYLRYLQARKAKLEQIMSVSNNPKQDLIDELAVLRQFL
ncbi:MAG: tRNA (adenine(22)-N(1))-methyltransferase [Bulleidia sp.]